MNNDTPSLEPGAGNGGGGGGGGGGADGARDRFTQRASEYHREQAVRGLAASLEDVAAQLDHAATDLRSKARTVRDESRVHVIETVVRELVWLPTKLGIDRLFILYGEFSRNFEE